MRPAIADQSTVTDEPLLWFLIALAALALFVCWCVGQVRKARRERQVDEWPVDDYLGAWECRVAKCDRTASVWVDQPYAGRMFVCHTCAHDGASLGWWTLAAS